MTVYYQMNTKKIILMDVVAIRLSLIFLLVVYHALCIYTGSWDSPFASTTDLPFYNWLGTLIHLSQLEAMVFISGLLLGHYVTIKPDMLSFYACVVRKAKRILLPCLFFGIIYYVMFYDLQVPWYRIIWKLFNGCGHLWFLPMIFWCFVLAYLVAIISLKYLKLREYKTTLLLFLLFTVINPFSMIPLGLGKAGNFFIYLWGGYCLKTKNLLLPRATDKNIVIACLLFVVSFLLFMTIKTYIQPCDSFLEKTAKMVLTNSSHTINAWSAIYLLYVFANSEMALDYLAKKPIFVTLSGYCYGVYIYQQFILKILYYHTQLPFTVNVYWLPWIATVITTVISLLLCHYSLKTRIGRFLIG